MRLTLYSRRGCHLCEDMIVDLERWALRRPIELDIIDIDSDPALVERYGLRIPVLMQKGRVVVEGRLDAAELEKFLEK